MSGKENRLFLIETQGEKDGAGKEDMYTLLGERDGHGVKFTMHWHVGSPSEFSEGTGLHSLNVGFTVEPEGLRQIRDAIDAHLASPQWIATTKTLSVPYPCLQTKRNG